MNLIIMFILNILSFSLSYTSSQDLSNLQRDQSRRVSIRNTTESFRVTPVNPQGNTPIFARIVEFSANNNDDDTRSSVASPINVQSVAATPISPTFETIIKEVFYEYYYTHPNYKGLIPTQLKERERDFAAFLSFLKIDSNFFKVDSHDFEKLFRNIYKIDINKNFTQKQQLEFSKYIKHEEAKEKIRQIRRIEKNIDDYFIEKNKKQETALK